MYGRHGFPSPRLFASASPRAAEAPPSRPGRDPTYYALFPQTLPQGPPPGGPFAIDTRALRREFLALQAAAHPDVRGGGGGDASAAINAAYRTLCSPLLRAQHLLAALHGVDLAADDAAAAAHPADAAVLTTVLEAHDELGAARAEGDLARLRADNAARMAESHEALGRFFAAGDVEGAVREAVRLRYWVNIDESIRGWEAGGDVKLVH